jgi:5-methylcytosine-specific restriction endonuclease McrA
MPKAINLDPVKTEIIQYYLEGHSLPETARNFGVAPGTIKRFLDKHGIARRSLAEAGRLTWNVERKETYRQQRIGKPSGASGKRWKYDRILERPARREQNNHFWKGGKTPLMRRIRTHPVYRFWRDQVFHRDNYTCVQCGARTGQGYRVTLNADHIRPFSCIIHDYNLTSLEEVLACQELWDVNNGRTLCLHCHKQTETYGLNLAHRRDV